MLFIDNLLNPKKCRVVVNILSNEMSATIPKLVQLITKKRTVLFQGWIESNSANLGFINRGIYLIKIVLPSGIVQEKIIKINGEREFIITFEFNNISPSPEMEWAYFAKQNASTEQNNNSAAVDNLPPIPLEIRALTEYNGNWVIDQYLSTKRWSNSIDAIGEVFNLNTTRSIQILEIRMEKYPPKYIRLPPDSQLKILIRRQISSQPLRHPIEVFISTANWHIETLLQLIKNGRTDLAKDLISLANAEELLRGKYIDANAASIGGYFLYKAGAYHKTLDWSKNLAIDFPFLPDGAVIYASQLINKNRPGKDKIRESREYYLIAARRGIPVYTIGFRLLLEGLTKMSNHFNKEDQLIENALSKFSYYNKMIDYTRDITTLNMLKMPTAGEPMDEIYTAAPGGNVDLDTSNDVNDMSSVITFVHQTQHVNENEYEANY